MSIRAWCIWSALIFWSALTMTFAADAEEAETTQPYLLGFEHRDLRTSKMSDLESLAGKPVALVFFEPDCSWCFRQVKVLKQLVKRCEDAFTPVALGIHGDRRRLKKELFKLKFPYPAYVASKQLVDEMDGIPATPIMLIADERGYFAQYFRGLTKAEALEPYLCSS